MAPADLVCLEACCTQQGFLQGGNARLCPLAGWKAWGRTSPITSWASCTIPTTRGNDLAHVSPCSLWQKKADSQAAETQACWIIGSLDSPVGCWKSMLSGSECLSLPFEPLCYPWPQWIWKPLLSCCPRWTGPPCMTVIWIYLGSKYNFTTCCCASSEQAVTQTTQHEPSHPCSFHTMHWHS